jgi:hypothetical protein
MNRQILRKKLAEISALTTWPHFTSLLL